MPISIKFLPENRLVEASHGETILEAAQRANVGVFSSCGGFGTCGTCRVWVHEGLERMSPRNEVEQEMAEDRGFQPQERLCCQHEAIDGLVLEIPEGSSKV